MPGGDRTGPVGMGPMTGRAAGCCAGYPLPGAMNPSWGRGFGGGGYGWGYGGGRGRRHRHRYYATGLPGWQRDWMGWPGYQTPFPGPSAPVMSKEDELEALNRQAEYFKQALEDLRSRIQEVESSAEGSKNT